MVYKAILRNLRLPLCLWSQDFMGWLNNTIKIHHLLEMIFADCGWNIYSAFRELHRHLFSPPVVSFICNIEAPDVSQELTLSLEQYYLI